MHRQLFITHTHMHKQERSFVRISIGGSHIIKMVNLYHKNCFFSRSFNSACVLFGLIAHSDSIAQSIGRSAVCYFMFVVVAVVLCFYLFLKSQPYRLYALAGVHITPSYNYLCVSFFLSSLNFSREKIHEPRVDDVVVADEHTMNSK